MTTTETEPTIYLCPRWCDEKLARGGDHDPRFHFTHVGMAGAADGREHRVDVVLEQDRTPAGGDPAPTRVVLWDGTGGEFRKILMSPGQARSVAAWLIRAADSAEGSPHF